MPLPHHHLVGAIGGASLSPLPSQSINKDVANGPKKEPLESSEQVPNQQLSNSTLCAGTDTEGTEEDHISLRLAELKEELLEALKEDISSWIVSTLGNVSISAETFAEALDTGVILCRMAQAIDEKAREAQAAGKLQEPLPNFKIHCNSNARSGTWFARDNTANFLKWCRAYKMADASLFDSEDLVTHHHEKQVIYCLMELARTGAKFGLEPPSLIQLEKEIDSQPSSPPPKPPSPEPTDVKPLPLPEVQVSSPVKLVEPRLMTSRSASTLDSEVNKVTFKCKCQDYVNRLSEGVYNVFGKRVYIRLLKGRHLMVRVGGGWDTFENYLIHHDPVQVFEFHQQKTGSSSYSYAVQTPRHKPGAFNGFLVIRSKYKSQNYVS